MIEELLSTDLEEENFEEVTKWTRSERKRKWFDDSDEDEEVEESKSEMDVSSHEIVHNYASNFEIVLPPKNSLRSNCKKPKLLSNEKVQIDLTKITDSSQPRPGPSGVSQPKNSEKNNCSVMLDFDNIQKDNDYLQSVESRSEYQIFLNFFL